MFDQARLKSIADRIENAPSAGWVTEMNEHYRRTGEYRRKDIRRVMGSQTEGVKFKTESTRAALQALL